MYNLPRQPCTTYRRSWGLPYLLGGSAHRRRPMAHASFSKSYYCTVLPTIAFYFLPYHHAQHTRSSLGSDRQSGSGSLPHLASLPIPSLGAGRTAALLAPSTTLATTAVRRCGAPACLPRACARWLRPATHRRPPCGEWLACKRAASGPLWLLRAGAGSMCAGSSLYFGLFSPLDAAPSITELMEFHYL